MLVNSENITECVIQFYRPGTDTAGGASAEIQHYEVSFTNARIVDIRFHMLNNRNPELSRYAEYVEVEFSYKGEITWIWNEGGTAPKEDLDKTDPASFVITPRKYPPL